MSLNIDETDQEGLEDGQDEFYEHNRIVVDAGQTSIRIDKFLTDKLDRISRQKIQNGIHSGAVTVNEKIIKPNYRIKPGDVISVTMDKPPVTEEELIPEDIPLNIVYEDEYLMVIYKDPGMVVHPGFGHTKGTLVNALAHYLKNVNMPILRGNPLNRPGLVHRIDKDTSGLIVIAKEEYSLTHLAKQFFDHSIRREYRAIVWGTMKPEKGKIDINLMRHPKNRFVITGTMENEGKRAITHYETVEDLYYVSLVKCHLETGRTHQIRAHFAYLGHPLFGDERYGGTKIMKGTVFTNYKQFVENNVKRLNRQALHAASLGFTHPMTGEEMYFRSEMPEDMNEVLGKWRNYIEDRKGKNSLNEK